MYDDTAGIQVKWKYREEDASYEDIPDFYLKIVPIKKNQCLEVSLSLI